MKLIDEIQARLLRRCGLCSVSKRVGGVLHLFVADAIHLGYVEDTMADDVEQLWIKVLEDMSQNWIRFSMPIATQKAVEALK